MAVNTAVILGALTLAGVLVYPSLKECWTIHRDNQVLAVERDALAARNDQINRQIEILNTPEGIESRAREEFNWVMPGEQAVNISGLTSQDSTTALPGSIQQGSVYPQIDWLTETLDFLFGYDYKPQPPQPDDVIIGL
jgi:cell division protein FtsB